MCLIYLKFIVNPLPKVSPPQQVKSDLRPIALTCTISCTIAKVMKGFVRSRLITQIAENIDPLQYAREGHSTADTLIHFLQSIHEASDTRGR